jgi:serine phosphatase RsbU (regulator of sigma subunit)
MQYAKQPAQVQRAVGANYRLRGQDHARHKTPIHQKIHGRADGHADGGAIAQTIKHGYTRAYCCWDARRTRFAFACAALCRKATHLMPEMENLSPEHLRTLYQITQVMNSSLDFDEVLNNVIDSIMQVMNGQRGFIMIANDETKQLQVLAARGVDGTTLQEEGYSTTIVGQVVETHETLLTNNAMFDNRYTAGKSIILRGLRAILCAPMLKQGRLIGVVYVDTAMKSGNFTPADRDLMAAVAGQAATAIENARLYRVAVEKGRLERELQMASEIQRGLLPRIPTIPKYQVAARWQAAREVAGDFYDVFQLKDNRFGVVIADVSDKGAPAALFMAVARTLIRSYAHAGNDAKATLALTNDLILSDAESGMFVTVYHSVFAPNGGSVNVNAGHNPPLLYRHAARSVAFVPRGGRAIGWFPDNPLQAHDIPLQPGDLIVYYTDGLTDAENQHGEYYGEARLEQAVKEAAGQSADDVLKHIVNQVEIFCDGTPPFDDLTLVIVRYTG